MVRYDGDGTGQPVGTCYEADQFRFFGLRSTVYALYFAICSMGREIVTGSSRRTPVRGLDVRHVTRSNLIQSEF
jgi:hypothetical protein